MLQKNHWMLEVMFNPVDRLFREMDELHFRRYMALCTTKKDGRLAICVHKDCQKEIERVDMFGVIAKYYNLIPVAMQAEAKQNGAAGFLCSCPKLNHPKEVNSFAEYKFS